MMKIQIDNLNINYTRSGAGDMILILPGWGANITLYEGIVQSLTDRYEVISLDLPGFGQSEEPRTAWDVEGYVDFVIRFLKEMNCSKVSLIGHSNGGRIIIRMANRKNLPFLLEKLVLVDSAGIVPIKTTKQKIKIWTFKFMKKIVASKPVHAIFPEALDQLKNKSGSEDYRSASPMMKQCMVKAVNDDLTPLLPNIGCETLLIWGMDDTATPLKDGKKMEELIPKAGLVTLEKAGHYSFLDQPYIFKKVMQSFFGI